MQQKNAAIFRTTNHHLINKNFYPANFFKKRLIKTKVSLAFNNIFSSTYVI